MGIAIDEVGNRYGKLMVIEEAGRGNSRDALWLCECNCGNTTIVSGKNLRSGITKSCGCLHDDVVTKQEVGNRYGRLLVIERVHVDGKDRAWWLCQCDCGNKAVVLGVYLRNGGTQSCGCLALEIGAARRLVDGEAAFNGLYSSYKISAAKRGKAFELSREDFRKLTQSPCYYCGCEPSQKFTGKKASGVYVYNGIDRMDNSKGYVIDNVVSCCKRCNRVKSAMSVDDFLGHIRRIYDHSIAEGVRDNALPRMW